MFSVLVFLLVLSVLVVVHEFGHFLVAKRNGVFVERFAIGFGPPIFRMKGKETEFVVCSFPLGGYVKLSGDSRTDYQGKSNQFLAKAAGVKMAIVAAGPIFNLLLAFFLFYVIAVVGFPYPDAVVGKVLEGYPAYKAGLQEGDRILTVNQKEVTNWPEVVEGIQKGGDEVSFMVKREDQLIPIKLGLKEKEVIDEFGRKKNVSIVGISPSSQIKIVKYGVLEGSFQAVKALWRIVVIMLKGFTFMILGILPVKEAVTGPLGIYFITAQAAKLGIVVLLHLMAVLSVSLAIVNSFPLPLLDGGHIVLFALEKFRKKSISEKVESIITRIGFTLFIILFVFILYNDLTKFGGKIWGVKGNGAKLEENSKNR